MITPEYFSVLLTPNARIAARRWLILGTLALGIGGIFAGLLSSAHEPFFYVALATHVDLTVLVWFLTIAGMFFTLAAQDRGWKPLSNTSFVSFAAGTVLIAFSAFGGSTAFMSNYIPVIYNPMFFFGLGLLFCGILGAAINYIFAIKKWRDLDNVFRFGIAIAALILLIAARCFIVTAQILPSSLSGQMYYEYAFWGGGHILQFFHTQFLLLCWLMLAQAAGLKGSLHKNVLFALLAIGLVSAIYGGILYAIYDPASPQLRNDFTLLMKHANGIAPLVLGIDISAALYFSVAQEGTRLLRRMLMASILLFAAGGALGYVIAGSNLIVPAHYHGSIVGITLAFMGVGYYLLPHFGYRDVSRSRLALWQPVIYGGGMLCWLAGMAMLGFHGVPRKTPGSADTMGILAATLKHSGDGIALIGGLLFVFIVLRAVCKKKESL